MELIPIIYLSLSSFAVLIAAIIVVSYFFYKVKNSSDSLPHNSEGFIELKPQKKETNRKPEKKEVKIIKERKIANKNSINRKYQRDFDKKITPKTLELMRLEILHTSDSKFKRDNNFTTRYRSNNILKSYSKKEEDRLFKIHTSKNY
jgi:hypothetical protein